MLENQPGTTPWVLQQDNLCFSDSNIGAAGINAFVAWEMLPDFGKELDVVGLLEQPWWLGVRKKRNGSVWKWVSSDGWSPKPQLCSCSAWIGRLDLGHEHAMILRLWAVSAKNRNGPVWGLGRQLWCLRMGRFILVLQLTCFLALEVLLLLLTSKKLLLWQNRCETHLLPRKENTSFAFPFSKTINLQTLSGNVRLCTDTLGSWWMLILFFYELHYLTLQETDICLLNFVLENKKISD